MSKYNHFAPTSGLSIFLLLFASVGVHAQGAESSHTNQTERNAFGRDSLDEVVISGTMRAILRSESPVPVEVYTPKFFMKNPTSCMFDAMQMINGVRPQINCNICNTGDIHINGLEGPYTMVLIDGMPIVSSLASVYGLAGIPMSMIARIEVVKGPASSLYGSEAVGGLINVITKDPYTAPKYSIDVSATGWQEYNADLGFNYRLGSKTRGLLGINYFKYGQPMDKNGDHFTDVTLQDRISVFNKLSWKRKEDRLANLAIRYVYEDRWGGELNWNHKHRGGDSIYGESIFTSRIELIGNYQLPVKEKLVLAYSVNRHDHQSAYGTLLFDAVQQVGYSQLTWEKNAGKKHSFLVGGVVRYTWYDDNTPATFDSLARRERPDEMLLPGIFIQDEISLSVKHKFLAGFRYDYDHRHGNIFTPRVAYKFTPGQNDIIRINAGSGFRVVNVFTEDHAALTGARTIVMPEALRPEKSYNVNVNYLKKMYRGEHALTTDLSVWYTYFRNRIVPDYMTNANQIIYNNLNGYAVSKGISASAEYGYGKALRITGGATLMDVSIVDKTSGGDKLKSRQLLTEQWTGTWSVSYTFFPVGITLDYTGNIYGPMVLPLLSTADPRPGTSPVWSIQNFQVSAELTKDVQIYGGIKNLLNWTPARKAPFLIARAHDPFDKGVVFGADGQAVATPENPYALTFDPTYVYAPNQGVRGFIGIRYIPRSK